MGPRMKETTLPRLGQSANPELSADDAAVAAMPPAGPARSGGEKIEELFRRLLPLLIKKKYDAARCFSELRAAASGTPLENDLDALVDRVCALEFDHVLDRLQHIALDHGWVDAVDDASSATAAPKQGDAS
jgi:hypothetical protein